MFADTHVHTLMKYVHNHRKNVWRSFWGPIRLLGFLNNLLGIPAFSQSDLRRLCKGEFQVIFFPLHPPEQKIMYTNLEDTVIEDPFEKLASQVISIPVKKIEDYKRADYNHFAQLNKELDLLINNVGSSRKLRINGKRVRCTYKVVRDFTEIEQIIQRNRNDERQFTLAIVLTIEGLHSLGKGHTWHNDQPNPFDVDDPTFMQRIDMIKGLDTDQGAGWSISPVVVNVTHAFDNGMFGHAQALSGTFRKIFDYAEPHNSTPNGGFSKGLNQPMSDFGTAIVKRLLNIDQESNQRSQPGKRIIPDIKHMSTKTRRDYYAILDEHNTAQPDDIIPVIMSHAAVNAKPSLDENGYEPVDEEEDYKCSHGFNPWSINLYDDEIIRIHETGGLIGIIFDERILAGKEKLKKLKKRQKPFDKYSRRMRWLKLIVDQIEYIVKTIEKSNTTVDKKLAWERICIGSDFDGQINPINGYKKATDFPGFKRELAQMLSGKDFIELRMGWRVHEVVEKICFDNVHGFLKRNFKPLSS